VIRLTLEISSVVRVAEAAMADSASVIVKALFMKTLSLFAASR
jgi:hypothetical protein